VGVAPEPQASEPEEFCRRIEAYLCRKNDGHLIRIVGPAFEQVCGWARRGIPLGVAERGIDRYFERYYSKGPRRRPVRVEFCEADVLDAFDQWRRATGIPLEPEGGPANGGETPLPGKGDATAKTQGGLPAHLDRVIARLTSARSGADRRLDAQLDSAVREIDAARATAKGLRGGAREALLQRLSAIDAELLDAARALCDVAALEDLMHQADAELSPFRARMLPDVYERARRASADRLLRERHRLPVVTFE
jgi:hypothetical protein